MPLNLRDEGRMRDILKYAYEAISLVADTSKSDFCDHSMMRLAVTRCVEVVGEAGWYISPEEKEKHPTMPWPIMWAMRNKLIHEYGRTNYKTIYDTVAEDLPFLIKQVEAILASYKKE